MSATGSFFENTLSRPFADLLRPKRLEEIVGQNHLLDPGRPLRIIVEDHRLSSMILWGPPGCGKTTLARILASTQDAHFEAISAILTGVADLRRIFEQAKERRRQGIKTLLFVDEIHHFNRSQQDSFLGVVEDGSIILIGATTENPSFELNSALLSRCTVFVLKRLEIEALVMLLRRAEQFLKKSLPLTLEARDHLITYADGDGRALLNMIEALNYVPPEPLLGPEELRDLIQRRSLHYDKGRDEHYNLISALHKSLRGSDVDAALYWYARMIEGGDSPRYIARRLIRFASEDIGLADPQALQQAMAAQQAYEYLGSPEGDLCIAQAVIYLATAPKSNAAYVAYKESLLIAKQRGSLAPPKHILNAPTRFMKEQGYGAGYQYDHDHEDAFSGQNYFPEEMKRVSFYRPPARGFEREIEKRLAYWRKKRK